MSAWAATNRREEHSWKSFRESLLGYSETDALRRSQLLFRGQADSKYSLQTTLDREFPSVDKGERVETNRLLLDAFRSELAMVDRTVGLEQDAIELLGRHHGLPSPLMDWTQSPYIAAYFAFERANRDVQFVSVWVFDRADSSVAAPDIKIIDDPELLRYNARALRQRGVFIRIDSNTGVEPLEDTFSQAVFRFDIRATDRALALADLDEMRINATELFPDVDGAARTACARVSARRMT